MVKDLKVDVLNQEGTFAGGDPVTGRVTFRLEKETKVKSVFVKLKGDANVRWSTGTGDKRRTYHAHRRYFKLKTYLVPENAEETALPAGPHAYNFSFKLPVENMPPSFKGLHGRIVYMLEAKVSRSWRANSVSRHELTFVNKFLTASATSPQVGSVEKQLGTFHKGRVKLEASVDKGTCCPGEKMTVVAKVNNSSSKKMTPKFKMVQKVVYRAQGRTNWSSKEVCKAVGNVIEPKTNETITCQMEVPAGQCPTINNCEIISLHYHIKAYLDISFAFDPEVDFQVVMLPAGLKSPFGAVGPSAYQPQAFGGPAPYQPQAFGGGPAPYQPQAFGGGPTPYQPQAFGGPTPYQPQAFGGPAPYQPQGPAPYQPQGVGGPTSSDFPPPYQQPHGLGGPTPHSDFPPPVAPMGLYPAVPTGPGAHGYPAAPGPGTNNLPGYSSKPPAYADFQNYPSYSNPMPQQTPSQPGFPVYPHLQTAPPAFNPRPAAPAFNIAPTAPAMNCNFLSEQKEEPPSYTLL